VPGTGTISRQKCTHLIYAAIEDIPIITGAIASDQTGQFPTISANGMKYIMVIYDYDSNAIIAEPSRSSTEQPKNYSEHILVSTHYCLKEAYGHNYNA
jgi:hypothetical protein